MARQIIAHDLGRGVIVDVGGGNSYSTVMLIMMRLSNAKVISLDVVNSGLYSKYGVEYRRGDCMATGLADSSVDLITCISTLEHVGLGRWGDPLHVDGDILAMREMLRILKPGGNLILTIPYGEPTVVYDLHRVYDEGRVELLASGFNCITKEYSLLGRLCDVSEATGRPVVTSFDTFYDHQPYPPGAPNPQAGTMLLLQKPVV
jgi:ubiquinone/menaquinone biosynthesis C-methylase UbiE